MSDRQWSPIHDFMCGFGFKRAGTVTVHSQHTVMGILVRTVSEEGDLYVYHHDAARHGVDLAGASDDDLDRAHEALRPLLAEERRKAVEWHAAHPFKADRITIPRIKKQQHSDLTDALTAQPLAAPLSKEDQY